MKREGREEARRRGRKGRDDKEKVDFTVILMTSSSSSNRGELIEGR